MDTSKSWKEYSFVAFDTETSGAYPIGYDIVEFGAVKWKDGKIIDELQLLIKPRERMTDFIIGIHGITNEMVENAPAMPDVIQKIKNFLVGSVPIAHHAPFDMGFVAVDFEINNLSFPQEPVLCSSLLSRKLIHDTENHKLQTLVKKLNINSGTAHRALDDARSCLYVGLHCLNVKGDNSSLAEIIKTQGKNLKWEDYSLLNSRNQDIKNLILSIQKKQNAEFIYEKSTSSKEKRQVNPIGIVRNPDGDYLMAKCLRDGTNKRFYLSKITEVIPLFS